MTPRLMLAVALLRLPATAAGHPGAATSAGRCADHGEADAIEADIVQSMHVGLLQKDTRHEAKPLEPSKGSTPLGAAGTGAALPDPPELAAGSTPGGAVETGAAPSTSPAGGQLPAARGEDMDSGHQGSQPAGAAGSGASPDTSLIGKPLPDIIGDIAGNILGDVAEGLVASLASAVSSALGPLTWVLGEAVNSTNESVQSLLGKLASADFNTTEKEQMFQAGVGAVLNSTARYWERISGIATTAVNASSLALDVLGQDELASQLSSVLDNVITFVDDQLDVLRRANGQIGALSDVMDDELVRQLFQVNETLSSVVDTVGQFEATIQMKITSFVNQAESSLGMSNTTALDPIEQQLNLIVSLVSAAVRTLVRGVSDAAVLVLAALENDPGLHISDSTFRSAPPDPEPSEGGAAEPGEGAATPHSGAARTLGGLAAMAAAVTLAAP